MLSVVMLEHEIHFRSKSRPSPTFFSFNISCSVMSPHASQSVAFSMTSSSSNSISSLDITSLMLP